jgi:hypothetical protein
LKPDIGNSMFDPDDLFKPNLEGWNLNSSERSAIGDAVIEPLPWLVIELDLPTAVVN